MKHPFKNPVTRPRAFIWVGVWLAVLTLVIVAMFFATTSYWFCASICHKVQDDTISSYQRSPHNKVSCVSCHLPDNANVVVYALHKVDGLVEAYETVTKQYEIPLNGDDEVAMSGANMPSTQCTQCHDLNKRKVTPSAGIIINHEVHKQHNFSCTVCHNRIAHNESGNWKAVNRDPNTGKLNEGHSDFMSMNGCFRCHRQKNDGETAASPYAASGACATCHTSDFTLKPTSHNAPDFMKKHGKMAVAETEKVDAAVAKFANEEPDAKSLKTIEGAAVRDVPNMKEINSCYTCHEKKFCQDCHGGVTMPHPKNFVTQHKTAAKTNPTACKKCHGTDGCTQCHHGDPNVPGYKYDASKSWIAQHNIAASKVGPSACFKCHNSVYCAHCHVTGSPN